MVLIGALRGHEKAILCLINVSDLLISGSADRTIRVWEQGYDGKYCCLAVLAGHQKPVRSLAAITESNSEDSPITENDVVSVFSGSIDGEIKVWQICSKNTNTPAHADTLSNIQ
ncbi:hypothetical protein L6164_012430 [Bauhinia variegata]|nr:hypothetical protein L6164_012430 [Bauhinia variegata]